MKVSVKMKRSFLSPLLLLPLLTLSLTGCDDNSPDKKPIDNQKQTSPDTPNASATVSNAVKNSDPEAVQEATEIVFNKKLNVYVDCLNGLEMTIFDSIDRYASWVKDIQTGPTGKESVIYGAYSISTNNINDCQKNIQTVTALKPTFEPMDSAASQFIESAVEISSIINDMANYYQQENYKDDAFAKGKTLHQNLLNVLGSYQTASASYYSAIDDATDQSQQAKLNKIEKKEGKSASYYILLIIIDARKINKVIEHNDFDVAIATEKSIEMEQTINILREMNKTQSSNKMQRDLYINKAQEYNLTVNKYIRRIRDKTPFRKNQEMLLANHSAAFMVEGSLPAIVNAYRQLVRNFNLVN